MKKMIAMLSVVAMLLIVAVPAFANPSITDFKPVVTVVDEEKAAKTTVVVPAPADVNTDGYTEEAVKALKAINDPEAEYMTVAEVMQAVDPEGYAALEGSDKTFVEDAKFVTPFTQVFAKDSADNTVTDIDLVIDFKLPEDAKIEEYKIMIIQPTEDGKNVISFATLPQPDADGKFTINVPVPCSFALVKG